MKCKNFILGALAALSIFVFFPTCEIGLGESVDTEPPTGSITSPGANAVIRDAFALQGEWHDEAGIKQVAVELKYNSEGNNKGKKYSYDATINKDNSWNCKIEPESKTQPLVDGTYLATIIIYDNGGHQTKLERSYILDNTAPVIVLQRPSSILSSSASDTDTYGQKFTIQGQAADDNNLNKIEVEIYSDKECTEDNLLKTITLNNVPLAINNDVASYVSGDTEKESDYSKIYFADEAYQDLNDMNASEASKTRYCKIIAYDGAQRYPAKGEEKDDDSTGNKQTNYYLYDDISGSILSTYKVNELYAMFNGTYSSSDSSRSVATTTSSILEQLEDKVQTVAKFNLNPKNNPTFSVSGKDQLTDGWTTNDAYNISSGSQVVVEVSPGLDGISLNKDSLKVYFIEYNATTKKVGSVKFYPVTERQAYGSGYKFITTINSSYLGDDNTSKTKIGSNYIFGVDGWDKSNGDEAVGNTIIASGKGYGFHLASSGVAPTLNPTFEISENGTDWTEVTDTILYLKAGTYVKVSGTVSVEEGTPDFSLLFGDTDSGASLTAVENSENKFSFTKKFEPNAFGTKTSQRQITVKAWQDKLTTSKTYTVYYDLEAPTISISEVKPIACKYTGETGTTDGKQYLNGDNVSIKLTISDNDSVYTASDDATDEEKAKNPKIEIEDSTGTIISNTNVTTLINFVWDNIHTTQLANGPITIRVTAYDRAGNKKEITNNNFEVDQNTDKPVILPNSASQLTFTADSEDLPASKNKFASGSQLILKLIDDDGLASITPWLGTVATDLVEKSAFSLPVSSTSETYTYNLPTDVGFHTLRFKLTDSNGKSTYVPSETGCFFVKITAGAPTIQEVKSVVKDGSGAELDAIYTKGDTSDTARYFENKVNFDSEYTKFNIYRATSDSSDLTSYTKIASDIEEDGTTSNGSSLKKESGTWVYTDTLLRPAATTTYYYYVAGVDGTDEEKSNKKNVTCKVDKEVPVVVLSALPGASDTKATSYIFSATSKDTGGSGIEKIVLTITDKADSSKTMILTEEGQGAAIASLSKTVTYANEEVFTGSDGKALEGYKTITLKAIDTAGNESAKFTFDGNTELTSTEFLYDKAKPTLSVTSDLREYMPNEGYTISGSVSDSYSIKSLIITETFTPKDTTASKVEKTADIIADVGSSTVPSQTFAGFQLPLGYTSGTNLADGTYSYSITLTDKKGNEDTITFASIVDKTAPTVTITTPETDDSYKAENAISGKTFQFEGDLEEDNSLSGVYYAIVANGAAAPSVPTADVTTAEAWENKGFTKVTNYGTTNWKTKKNFRVKGSAVDPAYPDSLEEGSNYKIIVYAVDKAGNVGHTKAASKAERSFDVDMAKPTIVLTQFDKASGTISSKFNISKTDDNEGKNGVFTVAGTSSDSLGLSKVEITYKKSGSTTEDTETITATGGKLTSDKWSKTFKFGTEPNTDVDGIYLVDGTYTFKIKATDLVGKVTELEEKTIIVDTISPVIGEISLDGSTYSDDTASSKWYKSTSIELEAIVTDTGSEVSKVQIANSSSSSQWTTINLEDGSTTKYSGTIKFANQGKNKKYYIKAEDKAGNTCTAKELTLNVDTSAPNLKSLFYKVGDGELKTSGGTAYINGTKDLTVYGLYDDQQSGVDGDTGLEFTIGGKPITPKSLVYSAAEVTKDASEVPTNDWISTAEAENSFKALSEFTDKTTIRTWKAVISLSTTQSGMLSVSGSNGAGDSSSYNIFTVSFDTKKPELDNFSLATSSNANTVYKENNETYWVSTEKYKEENVEKTPTFTFTGIATDNTGVESVILNIGGSLVIEYEKDSEGHDTTTVKSKSITGGTEYDIDRDDDEVTVAQWKFSGKSLTDTDQTTAILKVTDIAGNEEYKAYTIKFDNAAPVGVHVLDGSAEHKDLYFRVGNSDNDEISPLTDDDKQVGGKYSTKTYGNSSNIQIRGKFDDTATGSGVKMIYYVIYTDEPTTEFGADDIKSIITTAIDKNQYFEPLATAESKRVFYTADGTDATLGGKISSSTNLSGSTYYTTIESTYNKTISGFKDGNNYLVLVAVDKVGNAALDIAKDVPVPTSVSSTGKKDYNNFSMNVDTKEPELHSAFESETIYSNGTTINGQTSITITGTVTDKPDGACAGFNYKNTDVVVLTLKVGSTETIINATLEEASKTTGQNKVSSNWSAVIPASLFASASGNITVYGTAKDCAGSGNESTPASMATITVDRTPPTVTITAPTNKDTNTEGIQVNGKISLTGKITNEHYLTEDAEESAGTMVLYYTTKASLGTATPTAVTLDVANAASADASKKWRKFGTAKHSTVWEFTNINTRQLKKTDAENDYIADGAELYFTVTATDKAGNIGYAAPQKVIIDQDTDRPVITFSNITLKGKDNAGTVGSMNSTHKVWTKNDTLYGTITDDDGVDEVYIYESETAPTDSTNWGSNIYSNGAWEKSVTDGYKELWFKVVDSEGGVYFSSSSVTSATDAALLSTPKLKDKVTTDNTVENHYGYKTGSGITSGEGKNVLASTVYLQVDTANPEIDQNVYYAFGTVEQNESNEEVLIAPVGLTNLQDSTKTANVLAKPEDYGWTPISKISGQYIGGKAEKKRIYILYNAHDTNGIAKTEESFGTIKVNDVATANTGTKHYPASQTEPYSLDSSAYWQVVSFDLNELESNTSVNMALKVTDRANRTFTGNYYFAIDNEAPTVEFRNRSNGDSVYGSLAVSVTGRTTENRSTISKLYYGVTSDTTVPTSSSWTEFSDWVNTSSWTLTFDGGTNSNASESTAYHAKKLNDYVDEVHGSGTSTNNESAPLYLWVYAVDSLGNSGINSPVKVQLDVLTQGDKPSVEISYPSDGATVSSSIRLAGSSSVQAADASVSAVWIQVDPTYDGSNFNESWATELQNILNTGNTDSEGNPGAYDVSYKIIKSTDTLSETIKVVPPSSIGAGILFDGTTQSWNKTINDLGELNSKADGVNASIAVRVYAVSNTGKVSIPSIVTFTIDPDAPEFSELILMNKDDSSKVMKYSSGMWITGEWYLKGSITHSSGIKQLTKSDVSTLLIKNGESQGVTGVNLTGTAITGKTYKNWDFEILVGSGTANAIGENKFKLIAKDGAAGGIESSVNVDIKFDNKAPSAFSASSFGGRAVSASGNVFSQNNGTFTVKGTVEEGGTESGFKRAAFYFVRDLSENENNVTVTNRYFIDTMLAKNSNSHTDKKGNFEKLGTVNASGEFTAKDETISYSDGLYWLKQTGDMDNTNQLTLTSVPDHVRIGGLCKIDNVIYSIYDINNNVLTIDGEFRTIENQEVFFALAQVIDNEVKETGTTDTYDKTKVRKTDPMTNGDGDQMNEGITASGTTYTWEASINSKNILDGPVTLNFAYFDAAGNGSTASYSGTISNNAPRLAGVTVATDYNGNGTYESTEEKAYWVGNTAVTSANSKRAKAVMDGEELEVAGTNNSAFFTLKDKSEIRPEIIGGNGRLYYSYKIGPDLNSPEKSGNSGTTAMTIEAENSSYAYDSTLDDGYMSDGTYIRSRTARIALALTDFNGIENSTSDAPTWFQYTIWDETDGLEKYSTTKPSQNATMKIALEVQVHDVAKPTVAITPFYWKSLTDNSIYDSANATKTADLKGHIELENDLPSTIFNGSGLYDKDPKVSGKIVVRGTAYDNIRLKELTVNFVGHDKLNLTKTAATYSNGTWTPVTTTFASDGWAFTAKDSKYDETGHYVDWELTIDTEKMSDMTGTDKAITVAAKDVRGKEGTTTGGLTSESSTTQTTTATPTPYYRVDVVPYITAIHTSIRNASGLKDSNIRSASGKYSILANNSSNTITVNGFNFKTGSMVARIVGSTAAVKNDVTTSSGEELSISASGANTATITNSSITKSGYLELFSGGIRALNNVNKNDAYGNATKKVKNSETNEEEDKQIDYSNASVSDYKNAYNREADYNETKNVQLTDDRYLRFFDMKKTGTKNGYYPVMIMDDDAPVFGYVDANGCQDGTATYMAKCFTPQRRKFNADGTVVSTEYLVGGITMDQMGMAKDSAGKYYNVSVYNENGGSMGLYYDQYASLYKNVQADSRYNNTKYDNVAWQYGTSYVGYQGQNSTDDDNNAITLDGMNYSGVLVDRYQNLKLIADGDSTSTTGATIYQGYYDDKTSEVIFRQLKIGSYNNNGGLTTKLYSQYTNISENKDGYEGANYYASTKAAPGRIKVNATESNGSKYYDFGVYKNRAIFVYYDFSAGRLRLMYSGTLNGSPSQNVSFSENTAIAEVMPSYVGQYVSMAIDASGGIHIAAFDANKSDLKYIYISKYNADKTDVTSMTVDAAGSVGNWTSIKIDTTPTHITSPYYNKPVIAYYNATETGGCDAIKLAYANGAIGSITAGIDSNTDYTSTGWEYMTVPSVDPAQGGSQKFQQVCLDFDSSGTPVVGYLATNLEFGKWLGE